MTMGQSRGRSKPVRIIRGFAGRPWGIPLVVVAIGALIVVLARDDRHPAGSVVMAIVLIGAFIGLALVFLLKFGVGLAGFDGDVEPIASRLANDPDQRRLLARWLSRARWARFVGGSAGMMVWMTTRGRTGDPLLLGSAGIAVAAMLAEVHYLRRRTGPRLARLEVRSVGDYLMRRDARHMVGVAIVAAAVIGVAGVRSPTHEGAWWGLAAIAVIGTSYLAQRGVAGRRRPAVAEHLTRADDLARELAINRGLARPATVLALVLVARGWYSMMPAVHAARTLGGCAWCYAAYLWWHNRRLGLDFLLVEPRPPVLA